MDQTAPNRPTQTSPVRVQASRSSAVQRHLVLVNQPGWQDINDLHQIAGKVRWLDPTIGTFVVASDMKNSVSHKAAAMLPTLVVSFGPMGRFKPMRGKIYHGRAIHKFTQLKRLAAAGVPVPRTAILLPALVLDPRVWGEFVVVKPTDIGSSSHGKGIQLMRTERVRYRAPEEYPEGHPGRLGPMMVQQFVNTGSKLVAFRVLTLFDTPLYCLRWVSMLERPTLSASDHELEEAIVASQGYAPDQKTHDLVYDADVIAAAKVAARAVAEVPLKGCDVIREERSGRVYVLELNPGGNTWHFSSGFGAEQRADNGPEFETMRLAQFDAFNTAAHVLVQRTRAEAE